MNKRLNFVMNGKGGVGKSFFATNYVQYLKDRCIAHAAVDSDHENSTLKRFHPGVAFLNLDDQRELDVIFTSLKQHDLVVVDCRAASTDLLLEYFAEIDAFDLLRQVQAELTLITPVNHEADSVEQIRILTEALNDQCDYLVVRNEAHSKQFRIYDECRTRQRVLHELGGRELTMSRMHDWLVATLNANGLTVTAGLNHPSVPIVDRQRLKHWQREFYSQVDLVADILVAGASPLVRRS
jgi:hypothetical protein